MVQPAENWAAKNLPGPFDGTRERGILLQGEMRAGIIACPIALIIMSLSTTSALHDPNAPVFQVPIMAGAILYVAAFAFAIFYNFKATKSAMLALSTSMLQRLAVLGVVFIFLRWRGNEVNRGR